MKIRLCYRIEKEAGWGEDENGNPTEVFSCVKLDGNSYNVSNEDYNNLIEIGRNLIVGQSGISEELVIPITLNEYLDNTEEEEE